MQTRSCIWVSPKKQPSDPNRVLISALGAGEGGKTKRSHFIFEQGGKLVDKKIPVKPADRYAPLAPSFEVGSELNHLVLQPQTRVGVH